MNKQIIFIALCFFITQNASSQSLPYKSFSQFNGDFETYLKYNFVERADFYKGKTFGDLMKDIEITPIEYFCTYSMSTTQGVDTKIVAVTIVFKHTGEGGKRRRVSDPQLIIVWEIPFSYTPWKSFDSQYPSDKWVNQHYEFFKDKKIKLIWYGV